MAPVLQRGFPHRANSPFQGKEEMATEVKAKPFSRVSALLVHPHSLNRLWDTATPSRPQGPSWTLVLRHKRAEGVSQKFLTMPRPPEPITALDTPQQGFCCCRKKETASKVRNSSQRWD